MVGTKSGLAKGPSSLAQELRSWGCLEGGVSGVEMLGPELRLGGSPSAHQPRGACQEGLLQEARMGAAAGGEVAVLLRVDGAGQDLG